VKLGPGYYEALRLLASETETYGEFALSNHMPENITLSESVGVGAIATAPSDVQAPTGSLLVQTTPAGLWIKHGQGSDDWTKFMLSGELSLGTPLYDSGGITGLLYDNIYLITVNDTLTVDFEEGYSRVLSGLISEGFVKNTTLQSELLELVRKDEFEEDGGILTRSGEANLVSIAPGNDGYYLKSNGPGKCPEWSSIVSDVVNIVYPVGSFYVQYPDANTNTTADAFPDAKSPAVLFGGTWAKQWETEGSFFRTEGTPISGETETTNRTDGRQTDSFMAHHHATTNPTHNHPVAAGTNFLYNDGSKHAAAGSNVYGGTRLANTTGNRATAVTADDAETDGSHGTPRTGYETRPMNRLVRIWKRTA